VILDEDPRDMAIAPDGSVYVAGIGFISKYDRELVLHKTVALDDNPWINSIKVAPDGAVYIAADILHYSGEPKVSVVSGTDAILVKLNSDLEYQCEVRKNEPGWQSTHQPGASSGCGKVQRSSVRVSLS